MHISFAECFENHLGLHRRAEEAYRCIQRILQGRFSGWSRETLELTFVPGISASSIANSLGEVADALARIAWRPLTPRLVAPALGISGQERARRTKDGRLPQSGQDLVRRRGLLAVPTYAVRLVEELAAHPEVLAAWRDRDARGESRTWIHPSYKHILISLLT